MNPVVLYCNATNQYLPTPRRSLRKKGLTMIAFEYLPVGLAVLAVVARIAMFLPRQSKSQNQAA